MRARPHIIITPMITTSTTPEEVSDGRLYRLLCWLSPGFPIGAFSYSHGLEAAAETGRVHDRETLQHLAVLDREERARRLGIHDLGEPVLDVAALFGDQAPLREAVTRGG